MRTQRRSVTIKIVDENVTEDALGNETTDPRARVIYGCQFDPDPIEERASADQTTVRQTGILNVPGVHPLNSDDAVEFHGATWQVVGGGNVWIDRTKYQLQQARTR